MSARQGVWLERERAHVADLAALCALPPLFVEGQHHVSLADAQTVSIAGAPCDRRRLLRIMDESLNRRRPGDWLRGLRAASITMESPGSWKIRLRARWGAPMLRSSSYHQWRCLRDRLAAVEELQVQAAHRERVVAMTTATAPGQTLRQAMAKRRVSV